jgi:hypothetical protein
VQTCTVPCSLFGFSNSSSAVLFPSAILLSAISLQPKAPSKNLPPSKSLKSSFSESFIHSGKRGGQDIVPRGTCIAASLNVNNLGKAAERYLAFSLSSGAEAVPNSAYRIFDINILGKAAALHLTLALFCGSGCVEFSLQNIEYNCANVLIGFFYSMFLFSTATSLLLSTPMSSTSVDMK